MAATSGEQISRTSYVNAWGTGWFYNDTIFDGSQEHGYNESETKEYYFAAPCIYLQAGIKHRLMVGNGVHLNVYVYKYNGSTFELYANRSILAEMNSSDWHYATFDHNTGGSSDMVDNSDTHLWKIRCRWDTGEWPSRCAMKLYIRCGGIGVVPNNSTYNYMWKSGSKLYACACNYWNTSSFSSDTSFIDSYKPEAYSGTLITAGSGYMAYSKQE